ncbi:HAMP domain-containing sensor histidine kinase [uncultured Psychroserpens sp.]|uniref:sensor histidine kinase n=1 Tax=uncultured Psychroserpens sp. TaxID=255436 RepID=UPI00261AF6CE|nr:HAMP domain-containing sensor histidine kinase [uncultured Psychroserpens sp.]
MNKIITTLINEINEITRAESLKELSSIISDHLQHGGLNFQFYTIALIDEISERIKVHKVYGGKSITDKIDIRIWTENIDYSLKDKNILSFVVGTRQSVLVNGRSVCFIKDGKKSKNKTRAELEHYGILLKEEVFVENPILGRECNRIFIPIIHHSKGSNSKRVLGVFHVGVIKSKKNVFYPSVRLRLQLYIDNLAQVIAKIHEKNEVLRINQTLNQLYVQVEDNSMLIEDTFLEYVADYLFKSTHAKSMRLLLFEDAHYSKISDKSLILNKERLAHTLSEDFDLLMSESKIVRGNSEMFSRDKRYKRLVVPIVSGEEYIGILELMSTHGTWNKNSHKNNFAVNLLSEAGEYHEVLKFDKILSRLVVPVNPSLYQKLEVPFIAFCKEYFRTSYVSFWFRETFQNLNNNPTDAISLERIYQTKEIKSDCLLTSEERIIVSKFENPKLILCDNKEDTYKVNPKFRKFAKANDFKTIILFPLFNKQRFLGVVSIYLKRRKDELTPLDKGFISMVCEKFVAFVSNKNYFESLEKIQNFIGTKSAESIFESITKESLKSLQSDITFTYKPQKHGVVKFSNGHKAGSFFNNEIHNYYKERQDENIPLIEAIIRSKETRWLKSQEEISNYYNQFENTWSSDIFKVRFWERENINSCAIVQLKNSNSEILALMILNYREPQFFDDVQKNSIILFAQNMVNALEKDETFKDAILERDKAIVDMKYYAELTEQLMLKATRTSFYLILEGINHEIKNLLMRMTSSLLQIEKNSDRLFKKEKNLIKKRKKDLNFGVDMIYNLLKLFDFKQRERRRYSINEIVIEVVNFFERDNDEDENIEYDVSELDEGLEELNCYRVEFVMIFYNLITNAISAINDLRISTNAKRKGEISFRTEMIKNNYRLEVTDNGIGVDKSIEEKIFIAGFSKRKNDNEKGTGIGLHFVKLILEENYLGTIKCSSSTEKTTFIIEIPYKANFVNEHN